MNGDIAISGRNRATGARFSAPGGGSLAFAGSLTSSSQLDARGLELTLHGGVSSIDGSVAVSANRDVAGMVVTGSDSARLVITADSTVTSGGPAPDAVAGGLRLAGTSLEITHEANMTVSSTYGAVGISTVAQNTTIVNKGTIEVSGPVTYGIIVFWEGAPVRPQSATIVNEGSLMAGNASHVAIRAFDFTNNPLDAVLDVTNGPDGRIVGAIHFGTRGDRLENRGSITGNIDMHQGDDTAHLYYGSEIDGLLDGGPGTDTLILDGPDPDTLTAAHLLSTARFTRFESGVVSGGFWLLDGNALGAGTILDTLEIAGGLLHVSHTLAIPTTTITGGTLGGSGTLTGNVVNSGGVVSPGSSFGILVIDGDYEQAADAVLEIEIGPGKDGQLLPGEHYDQLVIEGTGTFHDGTTIRVTAPLGSFDRSSSLAYEIISGEHLVYDLSKINLDFRGGLFQQARLQEGSITLVLEARPFDAVAMTPHQGAVARALNSAAGSPGAQDPNDFFHHLLTALDHLKAGEEAKAQAAYESLSGEVYTQVPALMTSRMQGLSAAVHSILAGDRNAGGTSGGTRNDLYSYQVDTRDRRFWARFFRSLSQVPAGAHAPGAVTEASGTVIGGDMWWTTSWRAGLFAAVDSSTLAMDERASTLSGFGKHLGAYWSAAAGGIQLSGVLAYGDAVLDSERAVGFDSVTATARGELEAVGAGLSLEARLGPWRLPALEFQPVTGISAYHGMRKAFAEIGAGSAGLSVDTQRMTAASARYGLDGRWSMALGRARLPVSVYGGVAWVQDLTGVDRTVSAAFRGGGHAASFTVHGSEPGASGLTVRLGVSAAISTGIGIHIEYASEQRGNSSDHRLQVELSSRF